MYFYRMFTRKWFRRFSEANVSYHKWRTENWILSCLTASDLITSHRHVSPFGHFTIVLSFNSKKAECCSNSLKAYTFTLQQAWIISYQLVLKLKEDNFGETVLIEAACSSSWRIAREGKERSFLLPVLLRQPSGAPRWEGTKVLNPFNLTHQKAAHFQHLAVCRYWNNLELLFLFSNKTPEFPDNKSENNSLAISIICLFFSLSFRQHISFYIYI